MVFTGDDHDRMLQMLNDLRETAADCGARGHMAKESMRFKVGSAINAEWEARRAARSGLQALAIYRALWAMGLKVTIPTD